MNRPSQILVVFLLGCAAQPANAPSSLHAGPVYTAPAQEPAPRDGTMPVFPQLQILLDNADHPEALQASVLALRIDGRDCGAATKVQPFASSGHGIAAAFTIDVSGSMRGRPLNAIRAGLAQFVDDAGKQDSVAIQTIADDARWDAPWNTPRPKLRAVLNGLASRGRLTRLWDGAFIALDSFDRQAQARRLIVISDGHDEGSAHSEEQVIAAAQTRAVVVDAIGMTRSNPVYLKSLDRLAVATGGHFRQAANEKQLEQLIGSGIKRLKSLPLATFQATGMQPDGKVHTFTVTWRGPLQQTQASLSAPFPYIASTSRGGSQQWIWIGAAVAAVLSLLGLYFLTRKSKQQAPPPPVPSAAVAQTPVFAAAAAPASFAPSPAPAMRKQQAQPVPATNPPPAPGELPPRPFVRAKTNVVPHFPPPTPDHPAAWLFCEGGRSEGQEFAIDVVEFWIGALSNNHVRLEHDPTASGNHACIVFDHGVLGIFDHNSTNGTYVNNERVGDTRTLLRPGDRIQIGRSTFVLQSAPWQTAQN